MAHDLVCWKCGMSVASLSLPLSRRDECPRCRAELHVCKMCVEYDETVAKRCREPTAEEVYKKEQSNFCDFFKPRSKAWGGGDLSAAESARAELEKLFGKS